MGMKGAKILLLALWVPLAALHAQDRALMSDYQSQLVSLLNRVGEAPTDNERYLASEEAVGLMRRAMEEEDSERWQWQLPKIASVLTSPDRQLRIVTWSVVRDNGEYECFGLAQYFDPKEEEYRVVVLNDRSDEIMNREESTLTAANWFGAVYQELIQTTAGDRTYYTLLGWHGVDNLTDRKVIEPVTVRGGVLQFGAPLFRRERNLRRIVLEYTNFASVQLSYEEQTVREVKRERVKVKGSNRMRTVEKYKDRKERVIIFDEVEPATPGMEGLFQYYMPSGTEMAYAFVDGKWELRSGVQGRLKDKKLNKEFEPIHKDAPAYKFN